MPFVGATTIVMGLMMSFMYLTNLRHIERFMVGGLIGMMVLAGAAMIVFGRRSSGKFPDGTDSTGHEGEGLS